MPNTVHRLAVKDATAAKMLELSLDRFRQLVAVGALPPAVEIIPNVHRWRVADLEAILDGHAAKAPFEEEFSL